MLENFFLDVLQCDFDVVNLSLYMTFYRIIFRDVLKLKELYVSLTAMREQIFSSKVANFGNDDVNLMSNKIGISRRWRIRELIPDTCLISNTIHLQFSE